MLEVPPEMPSIEDEIKCLYTVSRLKLKPYEAMWYTGHDRFVR